VVVSKVGQEIIGIFNRNINATLSINQIAKILKKAYPNINNTTNTLIDENILNKNHEGRSYQCSINLENEKALLLLSLNEVRKKEKYLKKIKKSKQFLEEIKEIKTEFNVYTIFAHKTKLYFVLDHIYDKEAIKNKFSAIKQFKLVFLSKDEFSELIHYEPVKNQIIFYAPKKYFELIQEAHHKKIEVVAG
jgi:hypothetical protein